ncbi:MAG: c-type cytochrome biogenesis protein CcmI [Gammaproteobacteria bacterium]
MLYFWIICVLLIIISLIIIMPPLLAKQAPKDLDRKKINRAVYEKKLLELESDRDNDLIDLDQYNIAKSDLERSLIDDLEDYKKIVVYRSSKTLPVIVLVLLPALTVFTYLKLNNGLVSLDPEFEAQMASQQGQMPDINKAIAELEEKLKKDENNIDGWLMLGRSYVVSKRFEDAKNAYKKANELSDGANPDILISYGEAKGLAAGNSFDQSAMTLFTKALKISPNNERGLWYAGLASYQLQNYEASVDYLEKLLQQVPDEQSDVRTALVKYLNDAKQKAGIEVVEESATETIESHLKSSIVVNVKLSDELHNNYVKSDTLFIYARAMNGPKMPLALVKMTAGDLPTTVTLDDSVSMMPSMTLSSMEQVEVVARISKSGQAIMQSGDIIGSVTSVRTDQSETVEVVISELVP